MTRYSVLDLCPVLEGGTVAQTFQNTLELARRTEEWGYHRFWLAEHHGLPGVASAATAVLIGQVAAATRTMRVGSGGVMLPNHPPLVVAEQFATLEALFPGRIDLGLGRAPGSDPRTSRVLRSSGGQEFPAEIEELRSYFRGTGPVQAVPGAGLEVPLYLLGSSDFSARLAARLGLPYAFALHFAPQFMEMALALYRLQFQPSPQLSDPYFLLGLNMFVADTDAQARRLYSTLQQGFLNLVRRRSALVCAPVDSLGPLNAAEEAALDQLERGSLVGSPATVRRELEQLLATTQADEIIVTAQIYDPAARLRSFELAAEIFRSLPSTLSRSSTEPSARK